MLMYCEKMPRLSENMIGNMLINREDVGHNCSLKNTAPVVFKSNNHNSIFMAAQWFRVPVLSGAAVVAVEKN